MTNVARILRAVAEKSFQDREAFEEALRHADEICALEDEARYSGFLGLPPEPGSWGIPADCDREHP